MTKRPPILKIMIIILPIIIGATLTTTGILNYSEVTLNPAPEKLPYYGLQFFSSQPFTITDMGLEIYSVSWEDGYTDSLASVTLRPKDPKSNLTIALQVPHQIENVEAKILKLSEEGDTIEAAEIEDESTWSTQGDVSTMVFRVEATTYAPQLRLIIDFRWRDTVTRIDYYSYEVNIPIQKSLNIAAKDKYPDLTVMTDSNPPFTLRPILPSDCQLKTSIPQPLTEEIKWLGLHGESVQGKFFTFSQQVRVYGVELETPELQVFRVVSELGSKKMRYESLVFNSGLFIGVGIPLVITGVYEFFKYYEERGSND